MSVLDYWNPELGNRGDDLSAQAEDRYRESFDHSPSCETGPDEPEKAYREAEARECAAVEREIERRNLWEYYTQKIIVLLDASNNASDGIVAIDPNLLIQLGAQGLSL